MMPGLESEAEKLFATLCRVFDEAQIDGEEKARVLAWFCANAVAIQPDPMRGFEDFCRCISAGVKQILSKRGQLTDGHPEPKQ